MISIHTDKKLNIILPNTNKALAKVLKDATPKELEVISTGKDLKSIMNSLLKESSKNSSADKALLKLVKNNPILKELGSASSNIKKLLTTIKSDKKLLHVEKLLEKFIPNMKDVKSADVKTTLQNSGVFLESKLKDIKEPQQKLNTLLKQLHVELKNTKILSAKVIRNQIKEVLSQNIVKENPKALESLAKSTQNIIYKISKELKNADPITSKDFFVKVEKLQHLLEPKNLEKTNFKLSVLEESIKEIVQVLQKSYTKASAESSNTLNKIFQNIKTITQELKISDTQIMLLKSTIEDIKTSINTADPIFSKSVKIILKELSLLNSPAKLSPEQNIKEILSNDLKAVLHKVSEEISKVSTPTQTEVLKQVEKLSLQIDYYQLISHLGDASSLYIPFTWEQMQDGEITIQHAKDDKFYCDIDLKLKDFGELHLRLALYEKNQLNIHINSNNTEFKNIIKENIPLLRKALIDIQITPREIRLFNKTNASTSPYSDNSKHLEIGFEVMG